jgi:hypothetical protein
VDKSSQEEDLEDSVGTGTVYVAWDDDAYVGYWDSLPDSGPPGSALEQMPRLHSLHKAVEWGRARSPRVPVRPESDPGTYYWAGVTEPEGEATSLGRLSL